MNATTDRDESSIRARWDRIRDEERMDQARHVAQDAERDARIAAHLLAQDDAATATPT